MLIKRPVVEESDVTGQSSASSKHRVVTVRESIRGSRGVSEYDSPHGSGAVQDRLFPPLRARRCEMSPLGDGDRDLNIVFTAASKAACAGNRLILTYHRFEDRHFDT